MMNRGMTYRVQKNIVVKCITPPATAGHDMVDVPSGVVRDRLMTNVTCTLLSSEELQHAPIVSRIHLHAVHATLVSVGVVVRIERIVVRSHLRMTPDRNVRHVEQFHLPGLASEIRCSVDEHPAAGFPRGPVAFCNPLFPLVRVSSLRPPPQGGEQLMIDMRERPLGDRSPVVVRPSTKDGVQLPDEVRLPPRRAGLDDLPHLAEERLHVLPGRLDEKLAAILAEVPSEEVEALVDMDDAGLGCGEPKPSFREERPHQGNHLVLQQLSRDAGDDEVVRVSHQVDLVSIGQICALSAEAGAQQRLQSVESEVRQSGGDDPTLRRSRFRSAEPAEVDDSGLQPFSQHDPVHGDVGQQPVVIQMVEASFDVRVQYPLRGTNTRQDNEALRSRVHGGPASPKPVGVRIGRAFRYRLQREQVKCLHRAVPHRRDAQLSGLPAALGDAHSPQGRGLVSPPVQRVDRFTLGLWRTPEFAVHSRGPLTPVFGNSSDGQRLAAERTGQHALQGSRLALVAFPCSLRDAYLHAPHVSFDATPINGVPRLRNAGGSRHTGFRMHFHAFLLYRGGGNPVRRTGIHRPPVEGECRRDRSRVRHPPRGCACHLAMQTCWKWARLSSPDLSRSGIRAITARPSLFPASSTRHRIRSPCGSPASRRFGRRNVGLTEFRLNNTAGWGCALFAGHARGSVLPPSRGASGDAPFWFRRPSDCADISFVSPVNSNDVYHAFT